MKTRGVEIACAPCGIFLGIRELYGSESLTYVGFMVLDKFDDYASKMRYSFCQYFFG